MTFSFSFDNNFSKFIEKDLFESEMAFSVLEFILKNHKPITVKDFLTTLGCNDCYRYFDEEHLAMGWDKWEDLSVKMFKNFKKDCIMVILDNVKELK